MALRHGSCRQQLIVEEERAACVAMGRWEGRAAKAAARLAGVGRAAAISSNEPQLQYMETVAEVRESTSLSRQEILNVNDNECITVICIFLNLCTTAMAAVACRHAQFRTRRRAAAAGTNMPHKDRSRSMFKAALFGGGGGKKKTTNKRRQGNGDSGCVVITRPKRCRRSSLLTFSEACTAFISCRSLCVFDRLFKIPRVSLWIFSLLLLYYIPCCCLFISKPLMSVLTNFYIFF